MRGFKINILKYLSSARCIYFVLIFGILIRITTLSFLTDFAFSGDDLNYHVTAFRLMQHMKFEPYWPPGLSYYLAFFYSIFGTSELVGRMSMIVIYIIFSVFLYLLVNRVSNTTAANISALFFSAYPAFVLNSVTPLSQLPTATLLIMAVYISYLCLKRLSWVKLTILGFCLGCLVLVRSSNIFICVLLPLLLLVKSKKLQILIIPLLISIIIVSLWVIKTYQMKGELIFINTANGANFFRGNNPWTPLYKTWWLGSHFQENEKVPKEYRDLKIKLGQNKSSAEKERIYYKYAFKHIISRPDLFLLRSLNRARAFFAFDAVTASYLIKVYHVNKKIGFFVLAIDFLFYVSVIFLFIFFIFDTTFKKNSVSTLMPVIFSVIFLYAVPYWFSFSGPTYHLPIVPLMAIPAAMFLAKMINNSAILTKDEFLVYLKKLTKKRRLALVFILLIFIYIQIEFLVIMSKNI